MHTLVVTALLLTVTVRYLGRTVTMLVLTFMSLREAEPELRARILAELWPALMAAGAEGRKGPDGPDAPAD